LDGFGILTWADGSRYEGQFKDDWIEGKGKVKLANGTEYQGE
jgi:hypothetical protein